MSRTENTSPTGLEIAVVGLAGRFPGAPDLAAFWRNLRDGVESVTVFTDEQLRAAGETEERLADPNYVRSKAIFPEEPAAFDAALFGYSPRDAELIDPQHRAFLECAWAALEDAGTAPESFPGTVGCYGGVAEPWYFLLQIYQRPELLASVGIVPAMIGSSREFLTSRVAYKLDLGGPSVTVQSACSTSLVAIHTASQALLAGECDLALAGGAAIRIPHVAGYVYQQGGVGSPDGRCRSFDAEAQGTVLGDGVGVVVLKRLEDALREGDTVRAVIRGSAVNNDAASRVGYTAPAVAGQSTVIRTALGVAEVPPATVQYVETHGSATPLGDPTEVAALADAFHAAADELGSEPPATRTVAIGSVKSNIGHCDSAAGVAGFIKTVLALEHGELPPSLNFDTPNPQIDFDNGPFFVNTCRRPWAANGSPRRAGVSAFGLGGTNAHVVLEEAPAQPTSGPTRPQQLLVLSGQNRAALERVTDRFTAWLEARASGASEDESQRLLADAAHTLRVGRRGLPVRRTLLATDLSDAARALRERDPTRLRTAETGGVRDREVAFFLPGVGEQYVGMAQQLYDREPAYREAFDTCCDILVEPLGLDLRQLLFTTPAAGTTSGEVGSCDAVSSGAGAGAGTGGDIDLRRLMSRARAARAGSDDDLSRTLVVQPAAFAVGYALAQLLASWGVRPTALLGYSLGEYLAACLSGVLSLEDALLLVAERARLLDGLPAGAMLAVPLSGEEAERFMGSQLSLAATNAPSLSVLAGPPDAVAALEQRLDGEGLASRRLATTHAFHSTMMEPIADRFREAVARRRLSPPQVPYLSNVTGTWITAEQATDPDYYVRHLCGTVHFSEALTAFLQKSGRAVVEVGPGRALTTFLRQHQDSDDRRPVLTSLRNEDDPGTDLEHVLTTAGRLWSAGVTLDWNAFVEHEQRRRIPLPIYPFDHSQRYWIGPALSAARSATPQNDGSAATDPARASSPPVTEPAEATKRMALTAYDRPQLDTEFVAPEGDIERGLTEIWQELLGVDRLGIHDNFFELGGHSLLATQIVARVQEAFGVDLPLRAFSESPTPAELARSIRARQADGTAPAPIAAAELVPDREYLGEPFPLTDVQEAYWVGRSQVFQLGNVATHVYYERDVEDLDLDRYQRSWQQVIERHDMMRAIFLKDGRQQILLEVPPFEIPRTDLSDFDAEEQERRLLALRAEMSHQIRPVDRWPIYEIRASILGGGRHRLHCSFDFLIFDAASFDIVFHDLDLFYQGLEAQLPAIDISFRDYVLAEERLRQTEAFGRARDYWLAKLPKLPPAPELPLAKNPEDIAKPRFVGRHQVVPRARWNLIKSRAERRGLTSTALLLAVFSEVLATWCKSPRLTLNLTLFNRLPLHPQVDRLLGDFSSLMLLGVDPAPNTSFEERAQHLQVQLWDDLDHRAFSGVRVMRELARTHGSLAGALKPVVFTSTLGLVQGKDDPPSDDEPVDLDARGYRISQTPQVWLDYQVTEWKGDLTVYWDAVEELFAPGVLDAMLAANMAILQALAADEGAWARRRFDLLPDAQQALVAAANATDATLPAPVGGPPPERLHELFDRQVAARGPEPAVITARRTLSYTELDGLADRLVHRLRAITPSEPGDLIAVVLEKGWRQVVAVLGILRAGYAYLPIDPSVPAERLAYLLRHASAIAAVTDARLDAELPWPDGVDRIALEKEALAEAPAAVSAAVPATVRPTGPAADERDGDPLAYVIYTSGSTGQPKGVAIDHGAAVNTLLDIIDRFEITAHDRVLGLSALNFDLSVYDIFGTLGVGGALVLPSEDSSRDPATWAEWIVEHQVTVWNTVPALMQMLVEYGEGRDGIDLSSIRLCMMSGDWIPVSLPDRIRSLCGDVDLYSLGGATEASIWSILYRIGEVDSMWPSIPYGKPLRNQKFHVLDDQLEPRPEWVPGQLYISGIGLARGYWNDEEKTAASFIVHPRTGVRLYCTGDLGRRLPSGDIEFLGREDTQVKIQGYRIELGEIEAALSDHPGVALGVVAPHGDDHIYQRLVAYVVPTVGLSPTADELSEHLATKLPSYMVPSRFLMLDRLPLTANGKVDRKALPAPTDGPAPVRTASHSATAAKVKEVVAEVFGIEQVDSAQSLLQLGATSIEIIKLATQLHKQLGSHPEMERLFAIESVDALAAFYERAVSVGEGVAEPLAALPASAAAADDSYSRYFEVIFDDEERDRFKEEKRWLRRLEGRDAISLNGTDPASLDRWQERRSVRRFSQQPVAQAALAKLFDGLRVARIDGRAKWQYASAGGAYPVQVYLHIKEGRVAGLGGGTYYYDPEAHRLVTLKAGAELERGAHGFINWSIFDQSAFSIYLIADLAAIGPLYGPVSREYCYVEAGLMSQLLEETASRSGLGLCQIGVGGIDLERVLPLFELDDSHLCVHSLLGGGVDPALSWSQATEAAPIVDDWEEGEL